MKYLLSPAGKHALDRLVNDGATLLAFDFDGTLARIVPDREAAAMAKTVRGSLEELSAHTATAIVSGRSLEDLRPRVEGTVTFLIGNHGVQGSRAGGRMLQQAHDMCRIWIAELEKFTSEFSTAGIGVEDKSYSLTLHYRQARSKTRARELAIQAASKLMPAPRLVFGKAVVNVIPPGSPHKGSALVKLMQRLRCSAALYVGDDDTDEDVFALQDERIVTVRVGRKTLSAARYYLRRQSEIEALLMYLLRAYGAQPEDAAQGMSRPDSGALW